MAERRANWAWLGLMAAGLGLVTLTAFALPDADAAANTAGAHGGGSQLARDARAIEATGATGVLAATQDASGDRDAARAGVADLDGDRPVPYDSYYRIGSDTKTFTAVVALQLVAEGVLDLDDTVQEWLPGVVAGNGHDGSRITLANLLRQTSGLPDYDEVVFGDIENYTPEDYREQRFEGQTPRELVDVALRSQPPAWLPDPEDPSSETRWAYSNTNYLLAGMIIEEATGHTWEREVHERVVEPLGLAHTLTPGTSAYVPEPTATGYLQFPGREDLTETPLFVNAGPDGAIISTTQDLNTFLRALMGGELLPAEQLAEMKETVPAEDFGVAGAEYGMGIAWAPRCGNGEGFWFHGGTSLGTVSEGGVTEDGDAAVSTAVFTLSFADQERQEAQNAATQELVDHALCP
ncbi:serine hydrolase domain-containing protein [Streptomyces sp. B6B3]|uniref:serine hydrolase domain-containing protein n=1 Tax=Streptomyces sp. B6B3 TaxID=3153570 RepID=UPI00325C71D4